jgi:hypothetical protein
MVLFQLPQRMVQINADPATFAAPFDVVLNITLGPDEFFGCADMTGRLRELVGGAEYQMEFSPFQGMRKRKPTGPTRVPKFAYSGNLSGPPITFNGSVATIEICVYEIEALCQFIQKLVEILPAMFAPATNSPISILEMSGTVNGSSFDVRYNATTSATLPGVSILKDYFDLAMSHAYGLPRQIIAAKRYLAQNYLLEFSSEFAYQVTGERLLNLCKSLEALLPVHDITSVDEMKEFLRSWEVHERYIDVFTSLRYLRSQLDVAHISYTMISTEAHDAIDRFIVLAEECMQALIITAVKRFIADNSIYPRKRATVEDPPAVRHLSKYKSLQSPHNGDLTTVPDETDITVNLPFGRKKT